MTGESGRNRLYRGRRLRAGVEVEVWEERIAPQGVRSAATGKRTYIESAWEKIRLLRCYGFHSPTGFEFGYGGSGPSELALAILLDHLGELPTKHDLFIGNTQAQKLHQRFKWAFIAPIEGETFEITSEQIDAWLGGLGLETLFGKEVRLGRNGSGDGDSAGVTA